jgi:hypothetical protein
VRKILFAFVTVIAAALLFAKRAARDRSGEDRDEFDVAAILENRELRIRARPFLGGTVLVLAGAAELDLRRATPAPTGMEIALLVIGGKLRLVVPPDWRPEVDIGRSAAQVKIVHPGGGLDDPLLRVIGKAWLGRVELISRAVPTAVAS